MSYIAKGPLSPQTLDTLTSALLSGREPSVSVKRRPSLHGPSWTIIVQDGFALTPLTIPAKTPIDAALALGQFCEVVSTVAGTE